MMTLEAQLVRKPIMIGIDGGAKTGFAVWDRTTKKLLTVETLDFWEAYEKISGDYLPDQAEVVIEAPRLISPTFMNHGELGRRRREKIAGNVGGVKRESALLAEGLRRKGFQVREEKPSTKKWSVETFQRITGWERRTSQHGRDAAKLVYGY